MRQRLMRYYAVRICAAALMMMLLSCAVRGGELTSRNIEKQSLYEIPLHAPTIVGLTLLTSTFSDAEKTLGLATTFRESLEDEAPVEACYRSADEKDRTRLIFESDYTGGWKHLSGYTLTNASPINEEVCTPTKRVTHDLKVLDGHLWLGMTKEEVRASLGAPRVRNLDKWSSQDLPKNREPDHWVYLTTWAIPFTKADKEAVEKTFGKTAVSGAPHYDAWTQVDLTFKASRLVKIYVDHGESY